MNDKQAKDIVNSSEAGLFKKSLSEEIEQKQQSPKEITSPDNNNYEERFSSYTKLPDYRKGELEEWLSLKDKQRLVIADDKKNNATAKKKFFKPSIDKDKLNYPILKRILKAVLTGDPEALINLLHQKPLLFFMKFKSLITDPAQQIFRDVSPADLITFLGESDMQNQVNDFAQNLEEPVRTHFFEHWQEHQSARGQGGADIVMASEGTSPEFATILKVKTEIDAYGKKMLLERELLKNPDGIVCWKDPHDKELHWYYANPETKTLEEIEIPQELLEHHQVKYDALIAKMSRMEPQTARRSSNQEWTLFKDIMRHKVTNKPIHLVRQGIHYQQDGIDFIDTHYDANRWINSLLKCIRLYDEHKLVEVKRTWQKKFGHVEREVIWGIQRICEKERSFWPLADDYESTPFVRSFDIINIDTNETETVFNKNTEQFSSDLGLDNPNLGFAIYRGPHNVNGMRWQAGIPWGFAQCLLVAVNKLFMNANNSVDDFRPEVFASATQSLASASKS